MASSVASSVRERAFAPTAPLSATTSAPSAPSLTAVPPRVARPVRVCHVMTADLWAGAEVQLATSAAYLAAQPDIDISFVLFNEGRLAKELRALGLPVTVIDETTLGAAGMLKRLIKVLAARPFDVVHTHRYKDTVLGAIAARLTGVPNVVRTVHGHPEPAEGWPALKLGIYEWLDRLALRRSASVIVAVSKNLADSLRRSGFWPGMITAIHNGTAPIPPVPAEVRAAIRTELKIPADALVIGTVGRLVPVKGHVDLIRAIALALPRMPHAKLVIAGDGPLLGELTAMVGRLGIDQTCIFTGHRADVHHLLAAMDVFVLPSLSEGIPMALLEAMSLGVPVVATRVGGIPEVVRDRVTGLLVPAGDDRALAEACLQLARYPDWAAEIGAAGQVFVSEEYTQERAGRALADTYRSLCRARSSHRPHTSIATGVERVVGYPRRVISRAVERERMRQLRRDPSELTRALRSARRLLIVCHGNIIRSAYAAALLERDLARSGITVRSAGLAAIAGRPSHQHAVALARDTAIDLSRHAASPLSPEAIRDADVIFVMDVAQLVELAARFPDARGKAYLLSCLAPASRLDIRDPVDGDLDIFRACFAHIDEAVAPIARVLAEAPLCQ
jgi:glycosyltransferase involved in cell wall biosynthesis/protein-tyrosine-phosphatase